MTEKILIRPTSPVVPVWMPQQAQESHQGISTMRTGQGSARLVR